jgi:hypothetical protein
VAAAAQLCRFTPLVPLPALPPRAHTSCCCC